MKTSPTSTFVVSSALLLAACGGGGGALSIGQYAAEAEQVTCEYAVRCGGLPNAAACHYVVDPRQVQADIQAGKIKYNGVAARTCLDAVAARSCSQGQVFTTPTGCEDVVKGTVADGDACGTNSNQCASRSCTQTNLTCDVTTSCCPGTCGVTRTPLGGDCSVSLSCVSGAFCDVSGATPTCAKRVAVGGVCSTLLPCAEDLRCARAAGAAEGTCAAYPKRGEPCATASPCDDPRDFCEPATHTCAARVPVGGDCAATPEACVRFAACDATTTKCVEKGDLGAPCTATIGCFTPLVCTNGACAQSPPRPVCP